MKAIIQEYNSVSGKMVLQACIPFTILRDKAKFTYRTRPEEDPYHSSRSDYQRQLNLQHVKEIRDYISSSILASSKQTIALFPTSMLISYSIDNEELKINDEDEIVDIEVKDGCYIVDGQHRLKAMIDLYDKVNDKTDLFGYDERIKSFLESYKFNCSILLNYDLWEQSKIFADVNFKQKKVNKSLYYDIYGFIYSEHATDIKQNAIYLAHSLVEHLNNTQNSPLFKQIRMLGNGTGKISQAFLVEALLTHISSPRGIWYFDPFIEDVNKEMLTRMKNEIFSYLFAVEKVFDEVWGTTKSIIKKTTGMGALIRLMGYIHCLDDFKDDDYENIYLKYLNKCKCYQLDLFSTEHPGRFCGTGGKGLEVALYKELCYIIKHGRASWEDDK